MNILKYFKKKIRGKREYEMFKDLSYYDMFCVRDIGDRYFNSRTSWHFNLKENAEKFLELINKAK